MYKIFMMIGPSLFTYALNSQKRVTHSTIKVLHQPTSPECVTYFPCSLPRACSNDNEGKLQKFAMIGRRAYWGVIEEEKEEEEEEDNDKEQAIMIYT